MTMDLPTALSKLAYNRTHNLRKSQETFDAGVLVLDKNALGKLSDDRKPTFRTYPGVMLTGRAGWAFLEQLFLAAIDVGNVDVADVCLCVRAATVSVGGC
jgi:hypothetical protein